MPHGDGSRAPTIRSGVSRWHSRSCFDSHSSVSAESLKASEASALAEVFGLGAVEREATHAARGAMGEVFRVDTSNGPFALKRLFDGPTGDEALNVQFQFAAADAGVALAMPVLAAGDTVVANIDDQWWRAYQWIEGTHVPNDGPAPLEVAIKLSGHLGRLHAMRFDMGPEVDGWFLGASDEELDTALETAERCGVDVSGARRALPGLAKVSRMPVLAAPSGCHNDPDRPNVFVDGNGGPVLIDWDNAGACYPDGEFAGALWHWAVEGNEARQAGAIAAMTEAYRNAGGEFRNPGLEVFATMCSSW